MNASGGWPIQLTQSDERQYSPVWSPDGKWIVYEQDHAGDELWDLYATQATAERLSTSPTRLPFASRIRFGRTMAAPLLSTKGEGWIAV